LIACGVEAQDLVNLAISANFPAQPVRKLISNILRDAGIRRRKTGAGPKTPPEADSIADQICSQYGDDAEWFLGAAKAVCRARRKAVQRAAAQAALAESRRGNESLTSPTALIPEKISPPLIPARINPAVISAGISNGTPAISPRAVSLSPSEGERAGERGSMVAVCPPVLPISTSRPLTISPLAS
jgi:hypothetical protein